MLLKHIKSSDLKTSVKIQIIGQYKDKDDIPREGIVDEVFKRAKIYTGSSLSLRRQETYNNLGYSIRRLKEVIIRYMELDNKAKALVDGKVYDIKDYEDIENKKKFLLLICERVE